MSIWNFFDAGYSQPQKPNNWKTRLLYRIGRYLALRHKNVIAPRSCLIHPGAKINPRSGRIVFGENCIIASGAIVQGNVRLGDNCSVQPYTILVGYGTAESNTGQINVGNGVRMASHSMLIAANHRFQPVFKPGLDHAPITIGDNVWVAGKVNIMAGVTIGTNAVIGAGAVVTKDVPANHIAIGIPAKCIPKRTDE